MPRSRKTDKCGKVYEITKFIVRCDLCNDSIESISPEHTISCVCENLTIRGGLEDGRFTSCLHDLITDLSEWKLVE
jgi:hypothetical protein